MHACIPSISFVYLHMDLNFCVHRFGTSDGIFYPYNKQTFNGVNAHVCTSTLKGSSGKCALKKLEHAKKHAE